MNWENLPRTPLLTFLTSSLFLLLAIYFQLQKDDVTSLASSRTSHDLTLCTTIHNTTHLIEDCSGVRHVQKVVRESNATVTSGRPDTPRLVFQESGHAIIHDAARNMSCVGTERDGVLYFQNIFYAQDTCGPNRFAPPVNFEPARGSVIDATQSGAWCSQIGDISSSRRSSVNASENCLSLRIAVPSDIKADAKLPVVVFIHGGDHVTGSAYDGLFEPDSVIKEAVEDGQPLIWVAINYRLGCK